MRLEAQILTIYCVVVVSLLYPNDLRVDQLSIGVHLLLIFMIPLATTINYNLHTKKSNVLLPWDTTSTQ